MPAKPSSIELSASAPGKVVLWGEYAVLVGASAGVMAIDHLARIDLVARAHGWRFDATGLLAPSLIAHRRFTQASVAALPEAILKAWGYAEYPQDRGAALHIDSHAFYSNTFPTGLEKRQRRKLGIGSSAAVCVAAYTVLATYFERPAHLSEAIDIHKRWQGGNGSGLDVAASWHGGLLHFQEGRCEPFAWPIDLRFKLVWTGAPASTPDHVAHFDQWRKTAAHTNSLQQLADAAGRLRAHLDSVKFIAYLAEYIDALRAFDHDANLNIFTHDHLRLATIAARSDVIYKPCGAGGGDIGIAISNDAGALEAFTDIVSKESYVVLPSEIAAHGVKLSA